MDSQHKPHGRPRRAPFLLPALSTLTALLALAACGGGGGSADARPAPGTAAVDLVVATGTGTTTTLDATLDGVVLLRADGTATGNLLPASRVLRLSDPAAAPDAVSLIDAPAGDYRAARLALRPGSAVATGADGMRRPVVLTEAELELTFDDGPHRGGGGSRTCWQVSHSSFALNGAPTAPSWRPDLRLDAGRSLGWDSVRVQVASVNGAASTVLAVPLGFGSGLPVTLLLSPSSILVGRDSSGSTPTLLDPAAFLARIAPGTILEVDGTFRPDYRLDVRQAEIEDSVASGGSGGSSGSGDSKAYGVLRSVDPVGGTLVVQVVRLERGTLPPGPGGALPELLVRTTPGTWIGWSSRAWQPVTLTALTPGMLLEVEWRSAVSTDPVRGIPAVTAHEVEIEDGSSGAGSYGREMEGLVASVDVAGGTLLAVPRKDDPLIVGGAGVPEARVRIDGSTLLYLDHPSRPIGLGSVVPGMRVWVKGAQEVPGQGSTPVVTGREVRVRPD